MSRHPPCLRLLQQGNQMPSRGRSGLLGACGWHGNSCEALPGPAQPQREGMGPTFQRGTAGRKGLGVVGTRLCRQTKKAIGGSCWSPLEKVLRGRSHGDHACLFSVLTMRQHLGGLLSGDRLSPCHGLLIPRDSKQLPVQTGQSRAHPRTTRPLSNSHPRPILCCRSPGGTRQLETITHPEPLPWFVHTAQS